MVPGTPNGVVHQQPSGKRGAVVGAHSTDCEQFVAASRQQNRLTVGMSEQHDPVSDLCERQTGGEIWSAEGIFCFVQSVLPVSGHG